MKLPDRDDKNGAIREGKAMQASEGNNEGVVLRFLTIKTVNCPLC